MNGCVGESWVGYCFPSRSLRYLYSTSPQLNEEDLHRSVHFGVSEIVLIVLMRVKF